ncbi:unnamed protein product [Boreogadus saida]
MCLGDETEAPTVMDASLDATTGAPGSPAPVVPEATSEPPVRADDATTGAVTGPPPAVSVVTDVAGLLEVAAQETGRSTPETAAEVYVTDAPAAPTDLETKAPETEAPLKLVVPVVKCVVKEDIKDEHVKAVVTTSTCEETTVALQAAPAAWCAGEVCRLDVSQDGNSILVASPDATPSVIKAALQGEKIKESLGVSGVESSSSGPGGASVFVGVLLTGLLVAAGLIGGYCFKNRRAPGDKGTRLAEESYPVDVENQGNTLVSVAPLNPPPETQEPAETTEIPEPKEPVEVPEKPIENGEAPEEVKVDPPPPTNGTSTAAKTADTEL